MSSTPLKKNPHRHFPESENSDPNMPIHAASPSKKPTKILPIKPATATKPPPKRRPVAPPPPPRERPFIVVAKKNARRDVDVERRKKAAYDTLRASQEEFFRKVHALGPPVAADPSKDGEARDDDPPADAGAIGEVCGLQGSSMMRKLRSMVMEEAMSSIPDQGSGRVKHLVRAFETLLSISRDFEADGVGDTKKRVMNWALPGLGQPRNAVEAEVSSCSVSSAAESFPCNDFSLSINGDVDRLSLGSRTSSGSRRSKRNSIDSCGRSWNKMLKVTSQQPFKLRTEQRGRLKEENFLKKVKEMIMEDEKKRIPTAQGLPWTTEKPEVLVKPPVKERTEPINLVLHSDVRAVERAEFDHYVAERMSLAEQMRLERERQQKLQEEEEIRRLRRELVPRAQPMPYFDRPFVPKKSTRPRTIPKEPRFHIRPMKSSCISMLER